MVYLVQKISEATGTLSEVTTPRQHKSTCPREISHVHLLITSVDSRRKEFGLKKKKKEKSTAQIRIQHTNSHTVGKPTRSGVANWMSTPNSTVDAPSLPQLPRRLAEQSRSLHHCHNHRGTMLNPISETNNSFRLITQWRAPTHTQCVKN